jgi:hypothetical protein
MIVPLSSRIAARCKNGQSSLKLRLKKEIQCCQKGALDNAVQPQLPKDETFSPLFRSSPATNASLNELSKIMGMPGKPEGIAGTLRFAAELTEAGAMRDELADFRRKLSDAGRATYAARTGRHDDLVVPLVIAAWWAAYVHPSAEATSDLSSGQKEEEGTPIRLFGPVRTAANCQLIIPRQFYRWHRFSLRPARSGRRNVRMHCASRIMDDIERLS